MDSSPLVRPRHISISVRPIHNFLMSAVDVRFQLVHRGFSLQMSVRLNFIFMSAVDFEVKLNWSF
jgi:hypothetical protein